MKDKIALKNGTEIEIEAGASIGNIPVIFDSKTAMVETWDLLTDENLSSVSIKNSSDLIVANYSNLLLISENSVILSDGKISTEFKLREKTELELRLERIEKTQEIQDGAISDLGEAVSALSEMQEVILMGRFYGEKIKEGLITIDDVPKLWKKSTEKWLNENT